MGSRRPTTAVLIGAGQRGHFVYGRYAVDNPDRLRFVAVVDPDPARRSRFVDTHPAARAFESVAEWLASDHRADVSVVASPDRAHHGAVVGALRTGHHVLVEKPMAATLAESVELVDAAEATKRTLAVCHVLRYTPFFSTLHDVVASGRLGDLITVEHRENLWAFHMAHSFVRGNWSNEAESTPMIVQKCCHDFDILQWNLTSSAGEVVRLSSVGSLLEFRPDRAPHGATERCIAPCPIEACPYDARRYLNPSWRGWPVEVITDDLSQDGRLKALRDGPWGRCVYTAGSDVVDHQVVTMELASGTSVVLVMHGHSGQEERTMRYDGTRATLRARFGKDAAIEIIDHASGRSEDVPIRASTGGHGGGDTGVVEAFLHSIESGSPPLTSAAESLESHVLAFGAEQARRTGDVLDVASYRATVGARSPSAG